ncbi:MAG: hypothetical protein QW186_07920 [Candidatus Bathyarchaeia archaeon]
MVLGVDGGSGYASESGVLLVVVCGKNGRVEGAWGFCRPADPFGMVDLGAPVSLSVWVVFELVVGLGYYCRGGCWARFKYELYTHMGEVCGGHGD